LNASDTTSRCDPSAYRATLFTVYYRIEEGGVWIVHLRDDRRRPPSGDDL